MSTQKPLEYAEKNQEKFLTDLKDLVRIPSCSFPDFDHAPIQKSAQKAADLMTRAGLEKVEIIREGHEEFPYVYGEWCHAPGKPTILLYSHHDVQPPMRDEVWVSPAYEPTVRNGRLYGRGSADDKAGIVTAVAAIESWMKTEGRLPVNVKMIVEGDEESGSEGLDRLLEVHRKKLMSDVIVIVDAENYDTETPGITISLRGMVALTVEVSSMKQPVHSGVWGGAVPDPAMALSKIIAQLADDQGRPYLPGLIDNSFHQRGRAPAKGLHTDVNKYREQSGILPSVPLMKTPGDIREQVWFEPAVSVNAIEVSSRKQAGNSIAGSAWARLSYRTVSPLDEGKIFEAAKKHIETVTPWGVQVKVEMLSKGPAWTTATDHPAFRKMSSALTRGWGREPVLLGCGASIPFVQSFCDAMGGAPALLIAVEDPICNAHSENESMDLGIFRKATLSLVHFFDEMSR